MAPGGAAPVATVGVSVRSWYSLPHAGHTLIFIDNPPDTTDDELNGFVAKIISSKTIDVAVDNNPGAVNMAGQP